MGEFNRRGDERKADDNGSYCKKIDAIPPPLNIHAINDSWISLFIITRRRRLDTLRYAHKCQPKIIIKICCCNFNYGFIAFSWFSCVPSGKCSGMQCYQYALKKDWSFINSDTIYLRQKIDRNQASERFCFLTKKISIEKFSTFQKTWNVYT